MSKQTQQASRGESNGDEPRAGANFSRRGFILGTVGVTALGAVPFTAAAADAEASAELIQEADARHDGPESVTERFDRVVDLAAAGADTTGEVPIDDVLDPYIDDNTLVLLPDGRYKVKQVGFYKVQNWGLVGVGDDVTLVPSDDYVQDVWHGGYKSSHIWFENFTIDITDDAHSPSIALVSYDGVVYRDVTVDGFHNDQRHTAFVFRPIGEGGEFLVDNLRVPGGGNCVGVYANHKRGSITFRDCHIEGFWNNGLYASSATGQVHVEGGLYKNNNVSNIRIGSDGTTVRGATVVVDEDPSSRLFKNCNNMRGIRVSHGPAEGGTCYIEDCDVSMTAGRGVGGIVAAPTAGSFEVRDTRIHVDDNYQVYDTGHSSFAISVDNTDEYDDPTWGGHLGHRLFENVSITGDASYFMAARFQRGNNTLRNVCIQQTAGERDGLSFQYGDGNLVENCTVNVAGDVMEGPAEVVNLSTEGSCPLPYVVADGEYTVDSTQAPYADHSIPGRIQAEEYDVGGEGVAYHDTSSANHGGAFRDDGVDIENYGPDGTPNLGWISDGEWLEYTVDVTSGIYTLVLEVAGWNGPSDVRLTVGGVEVATVAVPDTGGFAEWEELVVDCVTVPVRGTLTLRVTAVDGSFNLNALEFRD